MIIPVQLSAVFNVYGMFRDGIHCPEPSHRKFSKTLKCNDNMVENYSCLFDEINKVFKESCTETQDFVRRGHKYVYRGGRDKAICSDNRFQPINFWSNESSQCIFLKNTCNELGQIVFKNGLTDSDRSCRCDYSKGFSFITEPQHTCYCIPSQEDCTCIEKLCLTHEVLSPDYECIERNSSKNDYYCGLLQETIGINTTTEKTSMLEKGFLREEDYYMVEASNTCIALFIASVVILGIIGIVVKYLYRNKFTQLRVSSHKPMIQQERYKVIQYKDSSQERYYLNIINVHREFLVEEMDTDKMMSALKINFDGDRVEKANKICSHLEKQFQSIQNIEVFFEMIKSENMKYIYRRLHTTQRIFSCTADVNTLSEYILNIKPWIVSSVYEGEEQCFGELAVILKNRNVISQEEIFDNDTLTNYDDINEFIDKIQQKGADAILTLLDALCIINENKANITENHIPDLTVNKKLAIIHDILIDYGLFTAEANNVD